MVEDAHVESRGAPRDGAADPSEAQDAERLAVHVGAPEEIPLPALPLARAREVVGLDDAPGGRHQERPREVGGGLGEDVGRVGHDDAAAPGGRDVDVVVADRDVRHDLEGGRRRENLVVDRADDVTDEPVLAPDPRQELGLGERGIRAVVVDGDLLGDQVQGLLR